MPPSPVQLARDEPMARELFPLGNDDRKSQFASDSLLEETVLSELVSEPNSLVTGKNTGIFIVGASEYN
jgi:hypothetical protein